MENEMATERSENEERKEETSDKERGVGGTMGYAGLAIHARNKDHPFGGAGPGADSCR